MTNNKRNKNEIKKITDIVLPKELENQPASVKNIYIKYIQISEELENHPLRYYTAVDRDGEGHTVDCLAVWSVLFKKFDKLNGIPQSDYDEVQRRCRELQKIKTRKGQLHRGWSKVVNAKKKGLGVFAMRRGDILEMFGRYRTIDQVFKTILDWGFKEKRIKVQNFYYDNLTEIKERQVRFAMNEKDFYLATTSGRIESLSYLYTELLDLFEESKQVRYSAEIRAIIEQVRKEIKGDEIRLTVDGSIDITASLQANRSLQELNSKIPINMFIVSLVAAKKGLNQADIMAQLTHSFYSNYNGFSGDIHESIEMEYPSHLIKNYDWGHIESIHKDKEQKATKTLIDHKLSKFFKDEGVAYDGNVMGSIKLLEEKLSGNINTEVIDVQPINTEVKAENKKEINTKRELLKQILKERIKDVEK